MSVTTASVKNSEAPAGLARFVPALHWLRSYEKGWLRFDLVAGITLAAYVLPSAIGTASLADLPPETGIYACLFSGLVFWLFCSSKHTAISVTSPISLLVGTSLAAIAGGDPVRFGMMATATALIVAALAFVAWLARAGAVVDFISETVMTGFKAGVALQLASTQLPKLFGLKSPHGDFWECSAFFFKHLGEANWTATEVGISALGILILGKIFLKNKPVSLLVVIGGIAAASYWNLASMGVKLIGEVPQGLPSVSIPAMNLSEFNELLPLAVACFLLGAVETAAIGRMFAEKSRTRYDSNQEFLALAGANLASAIGQGYPVSGGTSQSLVNEGGGARTPLSTLVSSGIILLVCIFLTSLLRDLPQPVVAAIVLIAVSGLLKISALKHLWLVNKGEFLIAAGAIFGILESGLLRGVMIGCIISLVQLLVRASRPHIAFLGRIPGTTRYSDAERNPTNELIPGMVIARVLASLLYFNIEHVRDTVLSKVRAEQQQIKVVVLDLSTTPIVDMQSAHVLQGMAEELGASGIRLHVVETRATVRDVLRAEGVADKLGDINRHTSVHEVVSLYENEHK